MICLCCHTVTKSYQSLCNPTGCSTPGFPLLHSLLEFSQTHVHCVDDAIQPSHPLPPSSTLALNTMPLCVTQTSLIAQLVRICLQCRRPQFNSWVRKICWRRDRLPASVFLGFTCGSAGKESTCNEEDLDLIPGLRRSPGEGKGFPLQYSSQETSMFCTVHGVSKSWTSLSDFHFSV